MDAQPPTPRMGHRLAALWMLIRRDERGASAVEYGLMVAGIAAVITAAVFLFGQGIFTNLFQETCQSIGQNIANNC